MFGGGSGGGVSKLSAMSIADKGYGEAIKICYGTNRVSAMLGMTRDFTAKEHKVGKGGGGKSYTYSATVMLFLGDGNIQGFGKVWRNKEKFASYTDAGFTYSRLGVTNQAAWGAIASFPENLNYTNLVLVAGTEYSLGSEGTLGNHSFEIFGHCLSAVSTDQNYRSAHIKDVITDFINNKLYGALSSDTALVTIDTNQIHAYCQARNILISPLIEDQKPAHEYLTEWATVANAGIVWSEGILKFRPYADESFTGHGVTFTPDTTIRYSFNDDTIDEFIKPTRKKPADCFNKITVECLNSTKEYNKFPVDASDQAEIEKNGLRPGENRIMSSITDPVVAKIVAHTVLQHGLYIRMTYEISGWCDADLLEPLDFVTITDAGLGLNNERCRVVSITDSQDGKLKFTVEEAPEGVYCG